jgi:hypothetical protein
MKMFKPGTLIDVSMSYDFSNVYDGIFVEYIEDDSKSFVCVDDRRGKEFKTKAWGFARDWTNIPEPIEKEIPKSGLSKKTIDALSGIGL